MAYPIRDGFTISVSGVESQEVTGIKTTIGSSALDTDLPTEKAVKDYVDAQNPMISSGDLIVGGPGGVPEALTMGTEGQVLTVGSSGLEWANGGGGGGGAKEIRQTIFKPYIYMSRGSIATSYVWIFAFEPAAVKIKGFSVFYTNDTANIPTYFDCAIYEGLTRDGATKITSFSRSNAVLTGTGMKVARGTFTSVVDLDLTKNHWCAFLSSPSTGSSILTYGEQIYGTVTSSTETIASRQNITSCPANLTSMSDSDGKMPGFMLHYEV